MFALKRAMYGKLFFFSRRPLGESNLRFKWSMDRNIRRILNDGEPKVPWTATDITRAFEDDATLDKYGFNLRRTERFYIETVQNENHAFTLFASRETMKLIEQHIPDNRRYLMDGTFNVTPTGCYSQLFIIYIEFRNDVSFHAAFCNI